ncbi:MAG: hypothetical protein ACI8ZM_002854 [Crocinitomix sp.]|jgi:hypothetical protein
MEEYEDYSDETLIQMMEDSYDLDESMFFVLGELGSRKHPRVEEFCLKAINDHLGYDEHFVSSAIRNLYRVNEYKAIEQINEHLDSFHIYTIGRILSLLWPDSSIYMEMPEKEGLIDTLKEFLDKKNEADISKIQHDYDEFIKAYG